MQIRTISARNTVFKSFFVDHIEHCDIFETEKTPVVLGNNPMVGATVAVAVAVQEGMTK